MDHDVYLENFPSDDAPLIKEKITKENPNGFWIEKKEGAYLRQEIATGFTGYILLWMSDPVGWHLCGAI